MQVIDGSIDKLVGKVQGLYGETREAVHDRVQILLKRLHVDDTKRPDKAPAPEQPNS